MDPGPDLAPPARRRPAIRWGVGDFVLVFVASIIGATVAVVPFVRADGTVPVVGLLSSLAGQSLAAVLALVIVARVKGHGTLRADFGFRIDLADWWWLLVGLAVSFAAGLLLLPINELTGKSSSQQIVHQFEHAHGIDLILFALGVVVLAPVVEELTYRGLLLRSLARRVPPEWAVFVSALVFGLVHVLGDSGSYPALPALVGLGVLSGVVALRTGRLSRSIFLHAGFNLLTAMLLLAR